jgi:hypothetical protein
MRNRRAGFLSTLRSNGWCNRSMLLAAHHAHARTSRERAVGVALTIQPHPCESHQCWRVQTQSQPHSASETAAFKRCNNHSATIRIYPPGPSFFQKISPSAPHPSASETVLPPNVTLNINEVMLNHLGNKLAETGAGFPAKFSSRFRGVA